MNKLSFYLSAAIAATVPATTANAEDFDVTAKSTKYYVHDDSIVVKAHSGLNTSFNFLTNQTHTYKDGITNGIEFSQKTRKTLLQRVCPSLEKENFFKQEYCPVTE